MIESVNISNVKVGERNADSYVSDCLFKLTSSNEVRIKGLGNQTEKTSEIAKMLTNTIPYVRIKKSERINEKNIHGIEITLENVH